MELKVSDRINNKVYDFVNSYDFIDIDKDNSICVFKDDNSKEHLRIEGKTVTLYNKHTGFEMVLSCDIEGSKIYNNLFKRLYNHIQTLLGFYIVEGHKIVGSKNYANIRINSLCISKTIESTEEDIFEFEYPKGLFTADNIYNKVCELLDVKENN